MCGRMLLAVAAVAGLATVAWAQPSNSQAAKKHPYEITPEAGPWAICVTCFFDNFDAADYDPRQPRVGMARSLAIDFVTELRKDYHMFGYMFNRGDDERKKEDERIEKERRDRWKFYHEKGYSDEEIKKMKFWSKRYAHVQDQYMVLIGGFQNQDEARKFLDPLRKLKAPSIRFMNQLQAGNAVPAGQKLNGVSDYVSPFLTAFVVPNPTVPVKKAEITPEEAAEMDLAQFNTRNPYNLLKHPGKWTLVVKAYRAPVKTWGLESKGVFNSTPTDANAARQLEAMGKQAEQLAALLRNPQLKFESYVMHANNFSLVTVGLYDSPQDPRMTQAINTLGKLHLDPETLISPAQPMMVPRKK